MENCEMIFQHTCREKDLWRGWLRNGQSVELSRSRYGWYFGGGVHVHSNDDDQGSRMLFLKFWRWTAIIPLGIIRRTISIDAEPQWSAYASGEFGLTFHWGMWRKSFDWPWSLDWHRTSTMLSAGGWYDETRAGRKAARRSGLDNWRAERDALEGKEWQSEYPYRYVLESGVVQDRIATVKVQEREWRRRAMPWTRIGAKIVRTIEVNFSDEVGERSGSWKGGCIGCSYEMLPHETPLDTLRRMERERKF